jgi:hypothetical protein
MGFSIDNLDIFGEKAYKDILVNVRNECKSKYKYRKCIVLEKLLKDNG